MKKAIIFTLTIFLIIGCSQSKRELYKLTDSFVLSLETSYESYGIFGATEYSKTTSDNLYKVSPIGRLINVKILDYVDNSEYKQLKKALEGHYRNDSRVNRIYICQAGTIMIDCRN